MRGFTLIELLVVIAIIAVLASILVPAVQQALHSAYGISTQANLRSIGMIMHQYASDHDDYFPLSEDQRINTNDDGVRTDSARSWRYQVLRYADLLDDRGVTLLSAPAAEVPVTMSTVDLGSAFSANVVVLGRNDGSQDPLTEGFDLGRNPRSDFPRPTLSMMVATGGQRTAGRIRLPDGGAPFHMWLPWIPPTERDVDPNQLLEPQYQISEWGGLGFWMPGDGAGAVMIDGHVEVVPQGRATYGHLQSGIPPP